jgi:hypothetical protein
MATVLSILWPSLLLVFLYQGHLEYFVGTGTLVVLLAFGLTGFFWMLLEGRTPPHNLALWGLKLARGLVFWGISLGLLFWSLITLFQINTDTGFEYGLLFAIVFFPFAGFILSLVLTVYSFFFIKTDTSVE